MSADPTGATSLSELLRAASALRPETILARVGADDADAADASRAGPLDALADHYAARLRETRAPAGARILLLGAPEPRALAAMVGALRAGLELILAPPTLDAATLAAAADRFGASALAGPTDMAGLRIAERLFEAGARAEGIRWIAVHGAGAAGAVCLDRALAEEFSPPPGAANEVVTLIDARLDSRPFSFDGAVALARDHAQRARLRPGEAIVSLVSLGAPGGLICGAFAPLLAGAHMIWQAPFSARRLLAALEASAPAHLFAPAGVARDLGAAGLLDRARLASLTLVAADAAPAADFTHDLDPDRVMTLRAAPGEPPRIEPRGDFDAGRDGVSENSP